MPKQVYTWGKVTAGDIISFRYKGKKATGTLTTLLVLNPRMPYTRKDKTKTFHLIGLKYLFLPVQLHQSWPLITKLRQVQKVINNQ